MRIGMKNILLDDKEKLMLVELMNDNCRKLFYDDVNIALEMTSKLFLIGPVSEKPETQNDDGEALPIGIDELPSFEKYEKRMEIFSENIKIDDIWVLRTLLYFSDFRPTIHQYINENINYDVTGVKAIEELMRMSTGGYSEFLANPESDEAQRQLNNRFTNLMDAGLIFKTNAGCITYYSLYNSITRKLEIQEDPFHKVFITEKFKIINIVDI